MSIYESLNLFLYLFFRKKFHAYVLLLLYVRHYLPLISPCFHIYPHHYHNHFQNSMCFVVCSLQFPSILSTSIVISLHKDSIFRGFDWFSQLGYSLKVCNAYLGSIFLTMKLIAWLSQRDFCTRDLGSKCLVLFVQWEDWILHFIKVQVIVMNSWLWTYAFKISWHEWIMHVCIFAVCIQECNSFYSLHEM